ncbi:MAG TPA: thiolase domain-containing protein [Acidimicrobiales bacterium]|jgi:acetyl-CoA acetyltransferase|nr:thiolase domain-containing protein [Acidimicrobiales bacterium]
MSTTPDIAIVAVAQTPSYRVYNDSEPSMIMRCVNDLLARTGLERKDLEFTIAGSCDYLSGMPFAFVQNIDGVGAWPPVYESHVEMDGAWALFEGWLRLHLGDLDVALVIGSGKSSPGRPRDVFPLQTDPYVMAPLGLDSVSLAGLQANVLVQSGKATERDFAEIVSRSRRDAIGNPNAQVKKVVSVDELLAAPYFAAPLRKHDLPPISDGAAAIVIARGDRARELTDRPVWIRGLDHRMESHHPGLRDLASSPSTRLAAEKAGVAAGPIDVAELMVNYSPEEIILRDALGLGAATKVNPSGGPLAGHPVMATGLIRIIEVAQRIIDGEAQRGVAHASSGPCLQQNLVCVLEGGK